ncbi:DUF3653 domain-containing protein [Photobacterium ganghwense]|uniref:DUF3653 domain-containing protein n=2 Tax=Vibrionales TaxID=135623 RepID=UPI0039EF7FCC
MKPFKPLYSCRYYASPCVTRDAKSDTMSKKITNNYIFRKFTCGLSREETAELCFKTVRTVTRWDEGQEIPPVCRRLMKLYSCRDLEAINENWRGWKIKHGELVTPNGWSLTPDRIVTGNALLEINAEDDRKTKAAIMKAARLLRKVSR